MKEIWLVGVGINEDRSPQAIVAVYRTMIALASRSKDRFARMHPDRVGIGLRFVNGQAVANLVGIGFERCEQWVKGTGLSSHQRKFVFRVPFYDAGRGAVPPSRQNDEHTRE